MPQYLKNRNKLTLAIHSTDDSFGFAYRENNSDLYDNFFVKKFEKDLCNNLIVDFNKFILKEKLKRRGYIAGKYKICISEKPKKNSTIKETIIPKIFQELTNTEYSFQAEYSDIEDLKELLNLSNKNSVFNKWEKVLPLYPISPIN